MRIEGDKIQSNLITEVVSHC